MSRVLRVFHFLHVLLKGPRRNFSNPMAVQTAIALKLLERLVLARTMAADFNINRQNPHKRILCVLLVFLLKRDCQEKQPSSWLLRNDLYLLKHQITRSIRKDPPSQAGKDS